MAQNPNAQLDKARDLLQAGHVAAAQALIETALKRVPRHPLGNYLLGMVRLMSGDAAGAVAPLQAALAIEPANGNMLDGLGAAYLMLERHADAETVLRQAAAKTHAPAVVHMRLGVALLHQQKDAEAVGVLQRAAAMAPQDADCRLNLARALQFGGALEAAYTQYHAALQLAPQDISATDGLAALCLAAGRYREAAGYLRGMLARDGGNADAWSALGSALFELGELDEAEAAVRRAQALNPAAADACLLLANLQAMRGDVEACVTTLEEGYARTRNGGLLGMLAFQCRQLCDWDRWRPAWAALTPRLARQEDIGSPFWLLCEPTTAAEQLAYTRAWAERRFAGIRPLPPPTVPLAPLLPTAPALGRRIRIGYLSSDLHEHAIAYLVADVLEQHDRSRFETYAYSYGPENDSPMFARMRGVCEHFVSIGWDTDEDAARRIRADGIDILVDLKGYTTGDRLTIMARRPCAVQITWLGYPGTTATSHIDYVIADPFLIDDAAAQYYSERVLRMPHCYQPNDRKRAIAAPPPRTACGLPAEAFVLCCFNQAYKITPEVWAVWMRLLAQVSGSVLWLLDATPAAKSRLLAAAAAAGIATDRVVFAPRQPNSGHVARYYAADLALDTFPYTSHTTASDALWCGCPLVALTGATFASRVSGSLLHAVGLAELVTTDLAAYEALALRLATTPALLSRLKSQLQAARDSAPLFDSRAFAADLELLYRQLLTPKG